ncbi:alpha/beta hydrolase [Roseobacter denitrificans]|uniref:Lipoprotein n=1 Tax=Roseobacter denitrificans (strain ATCC 33942 / OCh 114) TaxID=375451 RepID=Q16C49_ROSDO|nr:alpha/beta fold hydrolase [Roseobacter denitrificans]ABG30444.1 conserved hypothetical protein [Roseobacter denitrificans OCh 114]
MAQQDFSSTQTFIRTIAQKPGREVVLFIHGYNTTPSEALHRFAQVSHDLQISIPKLLFAWPSAGIATGYVYDRDSVLFSRDALADLLTALSRETNKEVRLIAHSMGAHLTMEVLRQLAISGRRDVLNKISSLALLAPDSDPDIFRAQAQATMPLPDPFVIMTTQNDRALNASAFINIGRQKVGDLSRAEDIEAFDITIFDFTALADGSNRDHLVPFTSPAAISVLRNLVQSGERGRPDLSQFTLGVDGIFRAKPSGARG